MIVENVFSQIPIKFFEKTNATVSFFEFLLSLFILMVL